MASRQYALRFIPYQIIRDAKDYGTDNYGDGAYGQEVTDPQSNVEYALVANPGEYPSRSGWVYRAGDTDQPFSAQVLGLAGPMDLTSASSAVLLLERVSVGVRTLHAYALTPGTTDGLVSGDLPAAMLAAQGTYRVGVQLQFTSGRCMTITPTDEATLEILGSD